MVFENLKTSWYSIRTNILRRKEKVLCIFFPGKKETRKVCNTYLQDKLWRIMMHSHLILVKDEGSLFVFSLLCKVLKFCSDYTLCLSSCNTLKMTNLEFRIGKLLGQGLSIRLTLLWPSNNSKNKKKKKNNLNFHGKNGTKNIVCVKET